MKLIHKISIFLSCCNKVSLHCSIRFGLVVSLVVLGFKRAFRSKQINKFQSIFKLNKLAQKFKLFSFRHQFHRKNQPRHQNSNYENLKASKKLLNVHRLRQRFLLFDFDVTFVDVSLHPELHQTSCLQDSHFFVDRLDKIKVFREIINDLNIEKIFLKDFEGEIFVVLLVE